MKNLFFQIGKPRFSYQVGVDFPHLDVVVCYVAIVLGPDAFLRSYLVCCATLTYCIVVVAIDLFWTSWFLVVVPFVFFLADVPVDDV